MDCTMDEKSFELYDEKSSIFNPASVADYNASLASLKQAGLDDAVEAGILDKAEANAQKLVGSFIKGLGAIKEYKIEVKTA